jgi:hypothetical protein
VPICLYGLIATPDVSRLPALQGIDASQGRAVVAGELAAVVSDLPRAPDRSRLDDVRAHDALLATVVAAGITAVASRFGQTFSSDAAVRDAVNETGDRIAALLRECPGCVEMRVLVPPALAQSLTPSDQDAPRSSPPGTAYLERARAALRGPSISLAPLLPHPVRAERVEVLPHNRGVVVAHLIDRAHAQAHRQTLQAHRALAGTTVVGPLALYSFAGPTDG